MLVPTAKLLIILAFVVRDQEAGGSNPLARPSHKILWIKADSAFLTHALREFRT